MMKKLGLPELFSTARMIKDSGMKADIMTLMESRRPKEGESADDLTVRIGKQAIDVLLENIANPIVEQWLYNTLAGITGQKPDEIKALSLEDIFDIFCKIKEDNDLVSFFGKLKRLMQK